LSRVCRSVAEWTALRGSLPAGTSVGFVPTMGDLHEGHLALARRARAENDFVVLSVFVNPTQFDDPADLSRYPRDLDSDVAAAGALVDAVFAPEPGEMYPDRFSYRVSEDRLSRLMEGAHRPGHFDGVLTVVLKLLNLVRADAAYFGEKDWQQLRLVEGMARAFFLPTRIVACPTVRGPDGLALSSRNARLSPAGRSLARRFPQVLRSAAAPEGAADELRSAGLAVDYVEDRDGVRLGAVRVEGVRLIDNVPR
jgi:pantoate--beta-alanine ligase